MDQINSLRTENKFKRTEIGEIPVEWEVMSLNDISEEIYRYPTYYNIQYVSQGIPEIRGEIIESHGKLDNDLSKYRFISNVTAERFPRTTLKEGDFVISVRGTMGKVAIVPKFLDGANITANLIRISPNRNIVFSLFLHQVFLSNRFQEVLNTASSSTTIKTIKASELKRIKFAIPSIQEQKRIAQILSSVDEAIEKKKSIIEKTKDLKKGVMQELLTRGIGHTKFKKTEIGEIPEEWDVVKVKDVCQKPEYGYTACASEDQLGPKFLRITDIQNGSVNWETVPYCRCPESLINDYLLKKEDILFARTGATTGKSYIIKDCPRAIFASYLIRITTQKGILPDYLYQIFNSHIYWKQINQQLGGSAQGGVNASSLSNIMVPLPSLPEQEMIADILITIDSESGEQVSGQKNLKKIKKELMQVLLTGKIRVKHI